MCTLSLLTEAQRTAQKELLSKSQTERQFPDSLEINYRGAQGTKASILAETPTNVHIPPLPKNMHPVHNQERIQARARTLHKIFVKSEDVMYVYAAKYASLGAMALHHLRLGPDDGTGGWRGRGHCTGSGRVHQDQSYSKRLQVGHTKLRDGMHLIRGVSNS